LWLVSQPPSVTTQLQNTLTRLVSESLPVLRNMYVNEDTMGYY